MIRRVLPLVLLALTCAPAFAGAPALEPNKTFLFSTSIVKWPESSGLAEFTDDRKDAALVAAFNTAGVASSNITFLTDERATLAAMRSELKALATRAGEGSTLVLSFQGHGGHEGGQTYFMPYDVQDDMAKTAFSFSEIAPILDACWKGDRLLLIGDCCHSGALADVVTHFEKTRVKAACFTSATASNRSTGHWTFTEAFIEALRGDGRIDRDHDGQVTFAETDRWIHEVMKYREGQLTHATRTTSFEPELALHRVSGAAVTDLAGAIKVGDFVEARGADDQWSLAVVTGGAASPVGYRVHFESETPKPDESVAADHIRAPEGKPLEVGSRYEVEWDDGEWFPGTVTKSLESWFYWVHYEGENGDDDEWIVASQARTPTPPEFSALGKHVAKKDDVVAARWRTGWYLAKVTAVEAKTITVLHGDGTSARVTRQELIVVAAPDDLKEGERVLATWNGEAQMYPGTLTKKNAKTATVRWEDGSESAEVEFGKIARIKP